MALPISEVGPFLLKIAIVQVQSLLIYKEIVV